MILSELKSHLQNTDTERFRLKNGEQVPAHFHVTQVGKSTKHYMDCGGTVRHEEKVVLQLWSSIDVLHRLQGDKLHNIINLATDKLDLADVEVEIEYQSSTVGRYGLEWTDDTFILAPTATDCLAKEECGLPPVIGKIKNLACTPGGRCC